MTLGCGFFFRAPFLLRKKPGFPLQSFGCAKRIYAAISPFGSGNVRNGLYAPHAARHCPWRGQGLTKHLTTLTTRTKNSKSKIFARPLRYAFFCVGCTCVNLRELILEGHALRSLAGIDRLPRLRELSLGIYAENAGPVPDFEFTAALKNLRRLDMVIETEGEPTRRFDMRNVRDMENLEGLIVEGFIIENFSALDALPKLEFVNIIGSEFYPPDSGRLQRTDIRIVDRYKALPW
jgi:hypothetical protein